MAVQKVYQAQIDARTGDTYRVCIYDLDFTAGASMTTLYGEPTTNMPIELEVLHETPEIRWDAEPDNVAQPIIGSSFTLGVLLGTGDDNKIKNVIKTRPENTLAVEVQRHNGTTASMSTDSNWDVLWRGVLVHEAIEYSWSNYPQEIQLTFTDGLSLLRDKAYVNSSGESYSSNGNRFAPLRVQIGRCLNELPHNALWGEQELYFTEQLDMFHWNHVKDGVDPDVIGSILDKTGCNQDLWYEFREHDSPYNRKSIIQAGGSTCYEILMDIMTALGLTLHHSNGIFQAISPFLDTDSSVTIGQRRHRADKRTMLDPNFQYSPYTQTSGDIDGTTSPNSIDYRDPEKVLMGSSLSYLPAVKGVMMTHLKGGAPYAFFPTHPVRIIGQPYNANQSPSVPGFSNYNPNAGGQVGGTTGSSNFVPGPKFPLQNDTTIAPGGESIRLKGRVYRVGTPIEDGDDALVGLQPILRFKIQVGDYYLKQTVGLKSASHFTNDSDFGRIRLAIGNVMSTAGTDITTWLPIEITDDVEWTTTESFFDLPFQIPGVNEPDVDVIEYDTGSGIEEYPVGVFTVRDTNHANQMRFRNEHANYVTDLMLDMTTPELPTAVSEHTGITVDCTLRAFDNTGTLLTGSGTSGAPDFGLNGNTNFCSGMYIEGFRVMVGTEETDEDTQYFASETNPPGDEVIDAGETTLATRPHDSYGEIGALTVGDGHRTSPLTGSNGYGPYWFSQTEFGGLPSVASLGRRSLQVLCEEHYRRRAQALNTVVVELLLESHHQTLLHPTIRVLLEQGSTDPMIQVQGCTHNLMSGVQMITGHEVERLSSGTVIGETSAVQGQFTRGPRPSGGGIPPGPMATFKSSLAAGGAGITAEQATKLAAITVTGNDISDFQVTGQVLDNSNVAGSASTSTTANLQQQITAMQLVTSKFSLNQANEITGITLNQNAISTAAINETSSNQFVSAAQVASIAANVNNISTLQAEVQAIENVIQSVTTGGGKGVYFTNNKLQTNAHLAVQDKRALLQAGSNTGVNIQESSPGTITMSVQAGAEGSESSITALEITGSSTAAKASINVSSPITTSSNGDITLNPDGTGAIVLKSNTIKMEGQGSVDLSVLKFFEAPLLEGNYVGLKAPLSITSDVEWTLPSADGTNKQVLMTNGSGTLSFTSVVNKFGAVMQGGVTIEAASNGTLKARLIIEDNSGSNSVSIQAPDNLAADYTLTLPAADGNANQVLATNGSGVLSFKDEAGNSDGWHGSTSEIKVLPSEFMPGLNVGRSVMNVRIKDNVTNTLGAVVDVATGKAFAIVAIPDGYKAVSIKITLSSSVSGGGKVSHYSMTDGAITNSQTVATNSTVNLTSQLTSSSTNALAIQVSPGSTTNMIHGATIGIQAV